MEHSPVVPVAVVGMACRLPGNIDAPEKLWQALLRGDDLVTEIPHDRWDADEYYDPEPGVPGRSVSKWGAFLEDVAGFDADFFGITDREAEAMDPQHRLLLETAWEAVEYAGWDPAGLAGSLTGVFMGLTHADYVLLAADARALEGPYGFTGSNFSMASGRVAYAFGVHGPALTVDTACSSGLLAVHLACRSLHEGESDIALAGGVSLQLEPRKSASGSAQGMLSATGRCAAFDVSADGFVAAEGCVVLALKRLPDAVADGDRILAVIRGTASNQDGRTVNIATPSRDAQVVAYRAALAAADVDPVTVGMVEAHGPGTPIGDPIEYASLAAVYGTDGPCALASVKTNFGHAQSASGPLGLMKAILALQHGVVPSNLHFSRLPAQMARIKTKLFIPQENTAWPGSDAAPRRAAVSSYGLSGTNVHAILEEAPGGAQTRTAAGGQATDRPLLYPLSSTSADELRRTAARLAEWIAERPELTPSDLAYTLARRRGHRPVRTSVIAHDLTELGDALREVADGDLPYEAAVGQDDRGPVWVFSGQGSQWAGMGAALLAAEPVFAATIAEIEPLIAAEGGFSVTEAMTAAETVTGINRVQPTLFAMQVALAAAMRGHGVQPGAVIGHSLGEVAAAVVAGALSLQDGVRVICRRSKLMSRLSGAGAMASVELPAQQVLSELAVRGAGDVVLSVVASPKSTVVGGATQSVRDLVAHWEQRGVMAREVAVDVASHSPQVDPILAELTEQLADIAPADPAVPYYSATLYDPRDKVVCDNYYWSDNLRHAVRFSAAVQAALEDGHRVFAELAPHPLLTHAVDQNARSLDIPIVTLASMRRDVVPPHGLSGFVADLHSAGAAVDFAVLSPDGNLIDAPLPTWTHRHLMLTREADGGAARGRASVAVHPLLGSHVHLHEEPERHVWQSDLGTAVHPWLADHQVGNVAALPGAAYCEMALAAAQAILGDDAEVRDIRFEQVLLLDEETAVSAVGTITSADTVDFGVETNAAGERISRAAAVLRRADGPQPDPVDTAAALAAHPTRLEGADLRMLFEVAGIQYGTAFTGLAAVHTSGDDAGDTLFSEVGLPSQIRSQQGAYGVHPALLDACFQSVVAHPDIQRASGGGLLLPLGVRRLRAYGPVLNARYCHTRVTRADSTGIEADLDVLDEHGTVMLSVHGLRLGTGMSEEGRRHRVLSERLLTIEWEEHDLPDEQVAEAGRWLLISTSDNGNLLWGRLTDALKIQGAEVATLRAPLGSDPVVDAQALHAHLGDAEYAGVVVVTASANGSQDSARRGREYVRTLVGIARELPDVPGEPPRLYVVTRNAQAVVPGDVTNLEQAGLRGLARVIDAEHPHLRVTQVDVDDQTDPQHLATQLLGGSEEDETAWRGGQWFTARMRPTPLGSDDRRTTVGEFGRDGMRLQIRTPGDVESMELVGFDRVPPGPGEIEVAVTASSINFADVLVAFGRYPTFEGYKQQLGIDFAGVVTAVGPDVTGHQVGDRVGGMSAHGCWSTFITCDARLAVTLPADLPTDKAAAVPTAHATAWYGLQTLARISAEDKVLIHSGTGGVGQAAIAIARAAGAEIYATAGSPQRRQMLRDMGIDHVYDSRSTEFADLIRQDTDGYGVDIVLNSLPGAIQRAGLELLAFGGRFIEIGKRDIYGDTRLGLFPFRRNLSFYAVDLALLTHSHPNKVHDLLSTVYRLTAEGVLPQPESTHYPLSDAATAVRVMGAAGHSGKLVLDVPGQGQTSVVLPPEQVRVFRADGAYVVTGGLGGLGLFLAGEMAAGGCGRIVLNSRSAPSTEAAETIARLRDAGADIQVECGDIAEEATAARLVAAATATGLPLRGVLHAAAVVEDATLTNISDALIERDWAPKVFGAWWLHQATADQPLDWFCSFSSAAALVGSPGQGAYAAANSWVDGFTRWRRAQGLPATAIAWGAWGAIGRATALAEGSGAAIAPDEGAHAFEALLRHNRAYTGYAPLMGTPWLTAFAQRSRFAQAFQATAQGRTDTSKFRAELAELPQDEWPSRLRRLVADQIGVILRRTIDPDRPLSEYGLDSLGNLELRTRIEAETGVRITTTEISTVRALADHLCGKLIDQEAAPVAT